MKFINAIQVFFSVVAVLAVVVFLLVVLGGWGLLLLSLVVPGLIR